MRKERGVEVGGHKIGETNRKIEKFELGCIVVECVGHDYSPCSCA